jgi:hypothetical protein
MCLKPVDWAIGKMEIRHLGDHRPARGPLACICVRGSAGLFVVGVFAVLRQIQAEAFIFGIDSQANQSVHGLEQDKR